MYGRGIFKGLVVTFKHLINTYVDDLRYGWRKYSKDSDNFETRQGPKSRGSYTVQYPDEKIAVPERFRFVPFLVVEDDDNPDRPGHDWCTSCGICAKVCPPQCIWIIRSEDPVTKRPVPEPEAFFIDIDICMNCGYCAEFCPFDAIKMDHDYEMASYDRTTAHIHDKQKLSKPFSYWKSIAPTTAYEEMQARGGWEHSDVIKAKKKQADADAKKAATPAPTPVAEAVATDAPVTEVKEELSAEERKAKREAALARKRAAKEEGGGE
ncbi:MAG: 4Fe-4S binding protein [bacterium]|nr:4Fe-4S binding protein [bacterium]